MFDMICVPRTFSKTFEGPLEQTTTRAPVASPNLLRKFKTAAVEQMLLGALQKIPDVEMHILLPNDSFHPEASMLSDIAVGRVPPEGYWSRNRIGIQRPTPSPQLWCPSPLMCCMGKVRLPIYIYIYKY